MVEMIMVIVIVGILAVVVIPKMMDKGEYEAFAFHDDAQALVRYAQKTAIAQRRAVYVVIGASKIQACFTDASCGTPVPDPGKSTSPLVINAPAGTSVSPATNFYFNGLGKPSLGGNLTVTSVASVSRQFTVEKETGLVHP